MVPVDTSHDTATTTDSTQGVTLQPSDFFDHQHTTLDELLAQVTARRDQARKDEIAGAIGQLKTELARWFSPTLLEALDVTYGFDDTYQSQREEYFSFHGKALPMKAFSGATATFSVDGTRCTLRPYSTDVRYIAAFRLDFPDQMRVFQIPPAPDDPPWDAPLLTVLAEWREQHAKQVAEKATMAEDPGDAVVPNAKVSVPARVVSDRPGHDRIVEVTASSGCGHISQYESVVAYFSARDGVQMCKLSAIGNAPKMISFDLAALDALIPAYAAWRETIKSATHETETASLVELPF